MKIPDIPPDSAIVWDSQRQAFAWTVTLPSRVESGHAETPEEARQLIRGWRTTMQPPRYVTRLPRGGIEPPAAP